MHNIMNKGEPSKKCSYTLEKTINAPLDLVWSIVRQFNNPKAYKIFIRSCSSSTSASDGGVYRNIAHVTGFPATTSVERLDELDDDMHVMVFSLVGGDQSRRLVNYQGVISLHVDERTKSTLVREKYTVDVAEGGDVEDVRVFVDTIVGLNLKSLARIAEGMIPGG
ncbi:abscisic acid receptor PYL12-like [Silene latifolia]|uniref:abscisic acid receptor PYL12-like n=1 Tax=Silene latifolia TaxID=37657 RepID=UPI003D7720AC